MDGSLEFQESCGFRYFVSAFFMHTNYSTSPRLRFIRRMSMDRSTSIMAVAPSTLNLKVSDCMSLRFTKTLDSASSFASANQRYQ